MQTRSLAVTAIILWVFAAGGLGYLFVNGTTAAAPDQRTAIILKPAERDLVLGEMRTMLGSVQGIIAGLSQEDLQQVRESARVSGTAIAQQVPAALMAKLPLEFKQLGMSVHSGFDELSVAVVQEEPPEMILARLSDQMNRCVACHARYRLEAKP